MKIIPKCVDVNAHIDNLHSRVVARGGQTLAYISFDNRGYGKLIAVKLNAAGYNVFGERIRINGRDSFIVVLQDLNIERNQSAIDVPIQLPSNEIRKLDLVEIQVRYSDGQMMTYAGPNECSYSIRGYEANQEEGYILTAIQEKYGPKFYCVPIQLQEGWVCGCGTFNPNAYDRCTYCDHNKDDAMQLADPSYFTSFLQEYVDKQNARRSRIEMRHKRQRHIAKVCLMVFIPMAIISVVVGLIVRHNVMMSERTIFESESAMRDAMQGTFTCFDPETGSIERSIRIDGDTYIVSAPGGRSASSDIEWNYRAGQINDYIVTSDQKIREVTSQHDDRIFEKDIVLSSPDNPESVITVSDFGMTELINQYSCSAIAVNNGERTYRNVHLDIEIWTKDSDEPLTCQSPEIRSIAPGQSVKFNFTLDGVSGIEVVDVKAYVSDYDIIIPQSN